MNTRRLFSLVLVLTLLAALTGAAASAPLAGPCTPGAAYDPACDANQDGHITITDIQLAAGHWNQNGAFVSDNNHNHLGQTWTGSSNPLKIQGAFGAPDYAPLVLNNSQGHGLESIPTASIDGIYVGNAGAYGMVVNAAGQDGVYVGAAGTPSSSTASTAANGFEVAGAQGHGLYVGRADNTGVYVNSAGNLGVYVNSAGNAGLFVQSAGLDGVHVGLAGFDGVYVASASNNGVDVSSAGYTGMYADTGQASGQWGFYTPDRIFGTIGMFSALSLVAQVSGPDNLTPGDIVAVAGIADPMPGSTVHTPLVRLAGGTFSNVVGVVESHLALLQQPSHAQPAEGETRTETPASELRSVDGPAQAGDYVAITVLGAAQVRVDTATPIAVGQRLTIAAHGRARALGTIKVQLATGAGTADLAESAPVIGVALGPTTGRPGLGAGQSAVASLPATWRADVERKTRRLSVNPKTG